MHGMKVRIVITLVTAAVLFLSGSTVYADAGGLPPEVPPLSSASVHDPSSIKAGDLYYVFGSHLAAAKSSDLRNWEPLEDRVHDGNRLIPNV